MDRDRIEQKVGADALAPLRNKMGWMGRAWVALLLVICLIGAWAYYQQLRDGLVVTGLRDYVSWGMYISQFVFLVAISLVGAIFSSILKLSNFEFRRPITRIAELIAVAAIMFAAVAIIVDMGRPERLYKVFTSGRLQSPIIWDVLVVNTYLVVSLLLLYVPMIPDLAYCRDRLKEAPRWKRKLYRILALNWQGTPRQEQLLERAEKILIVFVIPVAVAIHTVTSWLFATTHRPGWDSTAFGAYFVSGAFVAGVACVIIGMYVFRRAYGLKDYLTDRHFDYTGKLLVLLSLVYLYFNISEFLVPGYKMDGKKAVLLESLLYGDYAVLFWGALIASILLPAVVPIFRRGRTPEILTGLAVVVVIGHWWKRFAIVVPPLENPFSPIQLVGPAWQQYIPTWQEWAITAGIIAGVLLMVTVLARLVPIVPIYDVVRGRFRVDDTGDEEEGTWELMADSGDEDRQ